MDIVRLVHIFGGMFRHRFTDKLSRIRRRTLHVSRCDVSNRVHLSFRYEEEQDFMFA